MALSSRLAAGGAALLVVILIAIAVALLVNRGEAPEGEATAPTERESHTVMLAVLPFDNLGRPEDEYFAEGISEEIGARLARIAGLGVIARRSTTRYKGSAKSAREIGEELGVDYILEGTVRWERLPDGSRRVRVTPQLVRSSDASRLWGENYQEPLDGDVFDVQIAIAERVAEAMDLTLLDAERRALRAVPTADVEAYDDYLRGNEALLRSILQEDLEHAILMYGRAVERDPDFALAHARLSQVHASMYWLRYDRSDERRRMAKAAVDQSLALAPDLPDAHLALGYYYYWADLDYRQALAEMERARAGMPGSASVHFGIGAVQRRQGLWDQAIASFESAARLDPRSAVARISLGSTQYLIRNYAESRRTLEQSIELTPDPGPPPYLVLSQLHVVMEGSTARARGVLEQSSRSILYGHVLLDLFDRDFKGLLERLEHVTRTTIRDSAHVFAPTALYRGYGHAALGQAGAARHQYEIALSVVESEIQRHPDDSRLHGARGLTLAGLGRREEAIAAGQTGFKLLSIERDAWRGTIRAEELARIYAMVGEYDAAIEQLELLLSLPGQLSVAHLRLDPVWDPLRQHPRFQQLLEEHS